MQLVKIYRSVIDISGTDFCSKDFYIQGPICRGVGGLTLPMIFLTPRVSVDLSSWGVDSNPSVSVTC